MRRMTRKDNGSATFSYISLTVVYRMSKIKSLNANINIHNNSEKRIIITQVRMCGTSQMIDDINSVGNNNIASKEWSFFYIT